MRKAKKKRVKNNKKQIKRDYVMILKEYKNYRYLWITLNIKNRINQKKIKKNRISEKNGDNVICG